MYKRSLIAALWLSLGVVGVWAKMDVAHPQAYVRGYDLHVSSPVLAAWVVLPESCYTDMPSGTDLPVVAFYGKEGEPLPWRLAPARTSTDSSWQTLLARYEPGEKTGSASASRLSWNVRQVISTGGATSAEQLSGSLTTVIPASNRQRWWVDGRIGRIEAIRLQADSLTDFVGEATLDGSHDLVHWQTLASGVGIAHWSADPFQVRALDIAVADSFAYYRVGIAIRQGNLNGKLSFQGLRTSEVQGQPLRKLQESAQTTDSAGWTYRLPGAYPVSGIRVETAAVGTWGRGIVEYRTSDSAEWQSAGEFVAYRWQSASGQEFRSGSSNWEPGIRATQWRLRPQTTIGAFGQSAPRLEIQWRPDTLEFAPGGRPDVLMAVGTHPDRWGRIESLSDEMPRAALEAHMVGSHLLGGKDMLLPPGNGGRKWVVWLALGAALLLLAYLAYRLWREMGHAHMTQE